MLRQVRGWGVAPQHGCQCTHAAGFCCPPPSPPQAGGRVLLQPHGSALAHVLPAVEKIAEWGRGKKERCCMMEVSACHFLLLQSLKPENGMADPGCICFLFFFFFPTRVPLDDHGLEWICIDVDARL